jgi:hypothetical protein
MFTLCYIIKNKLIVFLRNNANYYTLKLFRLHIIILCSHLVGYRRTRIAHVIVNGINQCMTSVRYGPDNPYCGENKVY